MDPNFLDVPRGSLTWLSIPHCQAQTEDINFARLQKGVSYVAATSRPVGYIIYSQRILEAFF